MGGKTRNIDICVFVTRFSVTLVRVGASKWHLNTVLAIQFFETLLGVRQRITKVRVRIK